MAWASIRLQFYMAWSSAHLQFNMNPLKNVTQIWDITTIRTKACDLLSRSGIVDILRRSGYPESDTLPTIILNFHNNMHTQLLFRSMTYCTPGITSEFQKPKQSFWSDFSLETLWLTLCLLVTWDREDLC